MKCAVEVYMKLVEKTEARELRQQGYSLNEIKTLLNVSKSSVSFWVRDIQLNDDQKKRLTGKGLLISAVEKRRFTRLAGEQIKRESVINEAMGEIGKISDRELWLVGIMLYWAEGRKKNRGVVQFTNSDPEMIKLMMVFFRKICKVQKNKFRGQIPIHPHLDYKKAEKYWSTISGISIEKFYKTYRNINRASTNKKDTLPYGTFDICV